MEGDLLKIELDEAEKSYALQLAGCYVIETDVPEDLADTRTVHERYRDLALVERDFRTLKTGGLQVRPIYLRKGQRTRAHVFVTMLALKIRRELENRLWTVFHTTNENPHTVTVPDVLAALSRLCLVNYPVQEGLTVPMLPRPDQEQRRILDALDVSYPTKAPRVDRT